MSSFGAYEDEMGHFLRLSDEELARLLAGEAAVSDEAFDDVTSLLTEAHSTFATAPDAASRARHIAAISEASQLLANGDPAVRPVSEAHEPVGNTRVGTHEDGLPKWRRAMGRTVSVGLKALAGTMAASLSMVGLAYAGVDLPSQAAEQAIEAVTGIELPNQGPEVDASVSDDVRTVIDGDLEGCELGQAVADAADANRGDEAATENNPCTKKELHDAQGSKATGDNRSAEGRAKAAENSDGRSESGSHAAANGRATAADKSHGASDSGDGAAAEGQAHNPTGEGAHASDGAAEEGQAHNPTGEGADSGDGAAEEGQANNPTGRP